MEREKYGIEDCMALGVIVDIVVDGLTEDGRELLVPGGSESGVELARERNRCSLRCSPQT